VPAEFSSFQKRQLIFEARYDDAYLLWDRTGVLWTSLQQFFKTLKRGEVRPDRQTFHADGRFNIQITLNRVSFTDFAPDASWEKSFQVVESCFLEAVAILGVRVLNRVGTRFQYAVETKSIEDARKRATEYGWAIFPGKLFQIDPTSVAPAFKIEADDGEIGYIAQMYAQERKVEMDPPPDALAAGLEAVKKSVSELLIDLDFMTKKPMPIESFNIKAWLTGWQSAVNRDVNKFLNLGHKR
jgi:hypothetical protein